MLRYDNIRVLCKVGRITAFDCFEPQHAIIIKDKDEVSFIKCTILLTWADTHTTRFTQVVAGFKFRDTVMPYHV